MIAGIGIATGAGSLRPEAFHGRWSPRRAIPADAEPAATAAALALEDAGWWRPGSGEPVSGGLVVVPEGASHAPASRFANDISSLPLTAVGPSDFLFALPSSVAGVLGILFGLTDYQSTLVGGPLSGIHALRHAIDILQLGRLRRALLVALLVDERERTAVAWCLEEEAGPLRYPFALDCGIEEQGDGTTMAQQSAPDTSVSALLSATDVLRRPVEGLEKPIVLRSGTGWISLKPSKGFPA